MKCVRVRQYFFQNGQILNIGMIKMCFQPSLNSGDGQTTKRWLLHKNHPGGLAESQQAVFLCRAQSAQVVQIEDKTCRDGKSTAKGLEGDVGRFDLRDSI